MSATSIMKKFEATFTYFMYRLNPFSVTEWPPSDPIHILADLYDINDLTVRDYIIDVEQFRRFSEKYTYRYQSRHLIEKELEYFVSLGLLEFTQEDIFIDIASQSSPYPDIILSEVGCEIYRQDLTYPKGIHGKIIGGDAAQLPFPDEFFSKMSLHCSFEHFEGDADTRFIKEIERVLKPGGKVCILPLYLSKRLLNTTDPLVNRRGLVLDKGATVVNSVGWGSRFGRIYDVVSLKSRVLLNCGKLHPTIYNVIGTDRVDPSCYLRFVLLLERQPDGK